MSPSALPQTGAYPLTGVGKLPNAVVVFPGEVWSNKRASGVIIPGALVKEVLVEGVGSWAPVAEGDAIVNNGDGIRKETLGVALRQIMVPDVNPGSQYNPQLGPNEIVNLPIASGDWLRTYKSGVLALTLVRPDATYKEGDIIGWDPKGARPVGKAEGEGSWAKHASDDANVIANTDIFVVHKTPEFFGEAGECVLTVRFLRSNN
jgi:hypothetical protein